jgi:hypothetical protein
MFFSRKTKTLTRDELLNLAKKACEVEGWAWLEPIASQDGYRSWTVVTNHEAMGCNARITISKRTGEIVEKSFTPR